MTRKMTYLAVLSVLFVMGSTAQAVVIDMNSPQDGLTVGRGDTIQMTVKLTNDTDIKDVVNVRFRMTLTGDDKSIVLQGRPMRLRMEPGQELEWTVETTIPEFLPPLPTGPIDIVIIGRAEGLKSGTESNDTVSFILDLS
ncbi:MAG: hypothetical protein GWN67_23595 [Phycisphaerae bacterium]|nr:hypothetical protein [Phycisphaerae bacterium]NIP52520.1 hypothetical protein [Phycisphaerae bacterium]NIS53866.1 hypothetical protein [Phycisphaerae bacterium]NIU10925.1 hypothetical protein [Phycisphaerae bacterium]NIU59255.1 hypothetical protein [Phycisphaerae bacterium]